MKKDCLAAAFVPMLETAGDFVLIRGGREP
jgi:hypothetical protein